MFRVRSSFLLLALCLILPGAVAAQARAVTGTIRSQVDGSAIGGVTVRVKGSMLVVRSAADGTYRIEMPPQALDILVFSHPEYDSVEVELLGRTTVDVELMPAVRYNQYGVPVPRTPVQPEERDGILVFESRDGDYRFWFDLRIQADAAAFFGEDLNRLGSGAEMRRVRVAMKAQLTPRWYAEIDMDFADSRADVKDAYLMYFTGGGLEMRLGNFKEAFSLEQNTTSRYLTFLERPMVTRALTPSRHLGAQVSLSRPYFRAVGGIHFQDVGEAEQVQNRKDNNAAIGANEGYSVTGKVIAMPLYHDREKGLHVGLAGSYRTPKTHDRVGTVRFDVRGPSNIQRKKFLDTDRMSDVHHTILAGMDAAAYYRGLRVQGEYNIADVHRRGDRPSEHFNGWYVMGSVMLFGGQHRYNRRDGEFTQPTLGRSWGDVELAARYEYLDLNSRPDGVMGGNGEAVTIGVNVYPMNNVKFAVNYAWINHDRYANGRGSYFVGYDATGTRTRDPKLVRAPDGEGGHDYRALMVRVQVAF